MGKRKPPPEGLSHKVKEGEWIGSIAGEIERDEKIIYKGKRYPKHLFAHGKGPWENRAYNEEIKTT